MLTDSANTSKLRAVTSRLEKAKAQYDSLANETVNLSSSYKHSPSSTSKFTSSISKAPATMRGFADKSRLSELAASGPLLGFSTTPLTGSQHLSINSPPRYQSKTLIKSPAALFTVTATDTEVDKDEVIYALQVQKILIQIFLFIHLFFLLFFIFNRKKTRN
jgi:hypothetical protein